MLKETETEGGSGRQEAGRKMRADHFSPQKHRGHREKRGRKSGAEGNKRAIPGTADIPVGCKSAVF